LKQQLEQYLQELPVVGFNTGKYDVNAMKVDFFTRLVDSRHPLVREEPFLFCTLAGFQVLTITKAGRKIIADVDKLQLLCLDTHEDHERVPDMVQQQRRRTHVGSHRQDVSV
jgi:hypothetical protein